MTPRPTLFPRLLTVAMAATVFAIGCDPKLIGPGGGSNGGGGGSDPPSEAPTEVRQLTAILGLHMEVIQAALSRSGDFDSATPSPAPRGVLQSDDCITITTVDSATPIYELSLDGCVDSNGTTLRGGGELFPNDDGAFDGYYYWGFSDAAFRILGENADDNLNYAFDSGALWFVFERNGSGVVNGVSVQNFMRFGAGSRLWTFSYADVRFSGGIGAHSDFPTSDSVINVAADGIGTMPVNFGGTSTATVRFQGFTYRMNLDTGGIEILGSAQESTETGTAPDPR